MKVVASIYGEKTPRTILGFGRNGGLLFKTDLANKAARRDFISEG